jgi:PAS domain S-box-containing protein
MSRSPEQEESMPDAAPSPASQGRPALAPDSPPDEQTVLASFRLLVESIQDYAIFMLDTQGRVRTWNLGAQKLKGWRADEIIGRSFETFYTPQAIESGWPKEELRRAAKTGRIEDQGWRVRKDGSLMWASVVITALRDERGELIGFAKVTRDLTEWREREEALRQSEEELRLLVDSVKDYAIYLLDPRGCVLTWNSGAQALLGYTAAEMIGTHFSRLFTPEDNEAARPAHELARAMLEGSVKEQGWRRRRDGTVFWADVTLTAVRDVHGQLRGFSKVTRDLTASRRLLELEHASRRMSEFLAMLAHELRNPLAPIRNAVGIMQMPQALPESIARARDIVARQTDHMTRLVDDLLDVGRFVTGKILLRDDELDFRATVQATLEAARPAIDARHHELHVNLPMHELPMTGDAMRLTQALLNVLNNAARYTPEGGRIDVAVRADAGGYVTTVSDNGRGIAPEALDRIFELFVQEDARSADEGGLGIGLSLARTLVELHGGTLVAHSEGKGRGSRFSLRLPARRAPRDEGTALAAPEDRAPSRRVLVIDDNRDSADTMVELLRLMGHEARAAYRAQEAVRHAEAFGPDVVLLDLNMPETDGYAILRALRAHPRLSRAFVSAMTGYGQQADRELTLAAGFDAHLTKPVNLVELREVLANSRPGPQ